MTVSITVTAEDLKRFSDKHNRPIFLNDAQLEETIENVTTFDQIQRTLANLKQEILSRSLDAARATRIVGNVGA